jgi:hypothetical protein
MEFAGRLALTPYDLVHLLHAFHQLIKKLAQGYPRVLIVPTQSVGTILARRQVGAFQPIMSCWATFSRSQPSWVNR